MAFAYITRVMQILRAEHRDFYGCNSCNVCCTLKAVKCGYYMRGTKIFAFYKRIRPKHTKIWWNTDVENFALENAYTALRTWIGHKQRFLPQVYSLIYCNMMQHLGMKAKRLVYSLTWCSTIVQLFKYGKRLNSID